mmetsp:Transcript_17777/g.28345  ORF Transcript_17777/g.28345 Transcript_17777/m.28345 type:complete len:224 (+) Transcript_17777:701-1372(+)
MNQLIRSKVVNVLAAQDKRSSLPPDGLFKLDTIVIGQNLREDASKGTKHSPASVEELSLTVVREGGGVGRKSEGIPPVVSRVLAGEVVRNTSKEGVRKPLGAVRTVPLDVAGTEKSLIARLAAHLAHGVLGDLAEVGDRLCPGLGGDCSSHLHGPELARRDGSGSLHAGNLGGSRHVSGGGSTGYDRRSSLAGSNNTGLDILGGAGAREESRDEGDVDGSAAG